MSEESICCICREPDPDFTTACKHIFHQTCYNDWYELHATCPYCNTRQADIFTAIEMDDLELFKSCLDTGQEEKVGSRNERPVHKCVRLVRLQMLRLLLPRVRINSENGVRQTGLMLAVEQHNLEVIELFIEYKVIDKMGRFEKQWIANKIMDETEILDLFASHGCNMVTEWKRIETVRGVQVEVTPLLQAIKMKRDLSHIQQLVEKGAVISSRRLWELIYAIQSGSPELVRYFLELGADVNSCEPDGESQIMYAVKLGNLEVVRTLIDLGANVNFEKKERRPDWSLTVLDSSVNCGNPEIFELLFQSGARPSDVGNPNSAFTCTCKLGKLEMVKRLVETGADPTKKNSQRESMLKIAASRGDPAILEYLLGFLEDTGMTLSIPRKEDYLTDAVLAAMDSRGTRCLELLLRNGANPNTFQAGTVSVLMNAVVRGSLEIVKVVMQAGADVNAVNVFGKTALHIAASFNQIEIARYLLHHGAKTDIRNSGGETAFDTAIKYGFKEVATMIEDAEKESMIEAHKTKEASPRSPTKKARLQKTRQQKPRKSTLKK